MGPISALLSLIAPAWGWSVLLLDHGAAPEEDRFHQELALSLDEVRLHDAPEGFPLMPLSEQLDWVRPLLDEGDVLAVVWLDPTQAERLAVSVAFVSEDRAVVRLLELPREAGAEARLALAARELLAEEGMLDSLDAIEITENPPPTIGPPETSPWVLGAGLSLTWPLHPEAGGPRPGLALGAERLTGPVRLGAGLALQARPEHLRLGPSVSLGWGPLTLGARADQTWLEAVSLLQPRAYLELGHTLPVGLSGALQLSVAPLRDQVLAGKDVLYDSGWIEVGVRIGGARKVGGS